MEKDRISFTEEKKCRNVRRLKIIETLKSERNTLRDLVVAIEEGPHAKRNKEVFFRAYSYSPFHIKFTFV